MIAQGAQIEEEYYFSFLLDRANRTYLAHGQRRGWCRDRGARRRPTPTPSPEIADRPRRRRRRRQGRARSSTAAGFPADARRDRSMHDRQGAVDGLRRGGRHPRRGQPARPTEPATSSMRSTARSPSTRTPTSATRTTPRSRTTRRGRPARGEGQGEGPQLRQARRRRSASSATAPGSSCRTLDVVAYAGEEHGGVKPANFLDIGGGASAEVMADGLDVILNDAQVKSVFVNVFGGITACDAVANGIVGALDDPRRRGDQAARRPPRRQQRRGGPPHPRPRRNHPLVTLGRHHGRRGRQGRRAGLRRAETRGTDRRCRSSSTRTPRSSSRA